MPVPPAQQTIRCLSPSKGKPAHLLRVAQPSLHYKLTAPLLTNAVKERAARKAMNQVEELALKLPAPVLFRCVLNIIVHAAAPSYRSLHILRAKPPPLPTVPG